ncbi:hypothetical protein PLICRDRAFT_697582 [Plicaturopsis crispa FD-325 SS-3]|nr:hypothetical protein PLICRDRAFT_697582 [Plicaturopsis crispa FD-325 SS-3]
MSTLTNWVAAKTEKLLTSSEKKDKNLFKPKYVERGFQHPYCGRTCAKKVQPVTRAPPPRTCPIQGCNAAGLSEWSGFCSEFHGNEGVRLEMTDECSVCKWLPPAVKDRCVPCHRRGQQPRPRLRMLAHHSDIFQSMFKEIELCWNSHTFPSGFQIQQVTNLEDDIARYEAYQKRHLATPGLREKRTYFASVCHCPLLENGKLCDYKMCGICTAVKSSFRSFIFDDSTQHGIYGDGIYTYLNPEIADKDACIPSTSTYKVMVACDTLVPASSDFPSRRRSRVFLPNGIQEESVIDEEVVFHKNADAIIPSFIIFYQM